MVNTDTMKLETGLLKAELKTYKLPALKLHNQQSVEEVARCIFKGCSQDLLINFQRFSADNDEKSLMKIRVGMRRTRVAFRIFRDFVPSNIRKNFNKEFKYFGKRLGPASDLEELLLGTFRGTCKHPELDAAYEELKSLTMQAREQEYSALSTELEDKRLASLLESFDKWVAEDWSVRQEPTAEKLMVRDVGAFAIDIIEKEQKKLIKKSASLDTKSVAELHNIRKFVKRSRYQLRFLSSLFMEDRMAEGFSILIPLQNNLGAINDRSIGLVLMTKFCNDVQATHLPDCLSLIAAESLKAAAETKAQLAEVQKLIGKYENFFLTDTDFRR